MSSSFDREHVSRGSSYAAARPRRVGTGFVSTSGQPVSGYPFWKIGLFCRTEIFKTWMGFQVSEKVGWALGRELRG